ncbi:hypothetical protein FraQA3DRAFT_6027 [Frankia sp. QA3]|nr:hypothetical protein FraQA3DRAFT_6027 [Frankia sp. QA3]
MGTLRINIARGDDLAHPTIMSEWSNDAIALAWSAGPSGRYLSLAWTGNDPAHRLNFAISWDGVSFGKYETWVERYRPRWPRARA